MFASASLSLSVLMSHISGVINEIRTQIKAYCSVTNKLRTSITSDWNSACNDVEGFREGFPCNELIDFYETWFAPEEVYGVIKRIQGSVIGRTEKGASAFKEKMTVVGMSLYLGIMHALTEF